MPHRHRYRSHRQAGPQAGRQGVHPHRQAARPLVAARPPAVGLQEVPPAPRSPCCSTAQGDRKTVRGPSSCWARGSLLAQPYPLRAVCGTVLTAPQGSRAATRGTRRQCNGQRREVPPVKFVAGDWTYDLR